MALAVLIFSEGFGMYILVYVHTSLMTFENKHLTQKLLNLQTVFNIKRILKGLYLWYLATFRFPLFTVAVLVGWCPKIMKCFFHSIPVEPD